MMKDKYYLLGRCIVEHGAKEFLNEMNMSISTLYDKLNHVQDWTRTEMIETVKVLGLPLNFIPVLFFTDEYLADMEL